MACSSASESRSCIGLRRRRLLASSSHTVPSEKCDRWPQSHSNDDGTRRFAINLPSPGATGRARHSGVEPPMGGSRPACLAGPAHLRIRAPAGLSLGLGYLQYEEPLGRVTVVFTALVDHTKVTVIACFRIGNHGVQLSHFQRRWVPQLLVQTPNFVRRVALVLMTQSSRGSFNFIGCEFCGWS
jgi:hypothetical protein